MAGQRRGRGRRTHLDDFVPTADGGYRYTGQTHPYRDDRLTRRQALARLWALAAVQAGAVAAAGCLRAPGLANTPYVILPYVGSLLSAVGVLWLMGRLTAGGDPLPDYVYVATVGRFGARGMLALAGPAVSAGGEALYLALHGPGPGLAAAIGFLACQGLAAAAGGVWRAVGQNLRW